MSELQKVLQGDEDDNEVEITFMEYVRSLLQWPKNEDRLWVDKNAIICTVTEPPPTGKQSGCLSSASQISQSLNHIKCFTYHFRCETCSLRMGIVVCLFVC